MEDFTPLYIKLYIKLKSKIKIGEIPYEYRLPSIVQMSEMERISTQTVKKAYQKLIDENYIISKRSSGYYVIYKDDKKVTS